MIAENVYRIGFSAEFIGKMNTAAQAYTSGGTWCPDRASIPTKCMKNLTSKKLLITIIPNRQYTKYL